MPTYEYECKTCGHTFEVFQAMSDEPIKKCPECGWSVRRLIFGGAGVIFKGSGFYVTDKGKGSSGGAAKSGKSESAAKDGAASPQGAAAASPPAGGAKTEGGKNGSGEAPKTAAKTD